jgi:hypothetical protein
MKIEYSQHSLDKIEILKKHGVDISKEMIEETVIEPEKVVEGYKNRIIAQKTLDENHVLRVVYEKNNDDIFVVTIYPGRSTRYDKS